MESWFKSSNSKKGSSSRPNSQNMSRPVSETDFGDLDEEMKMYESSIYSLNDIEVNKRFEVLLVSNYNRITAEL